MKRYALIIALSAVALSACKQDAPPTPLPEPVADASAEAAPGAVTAQVDHGSPAGDTGFDTKAFAGTYGGMLACADCAGIDTTIAFSPEGTYTLSEVYDDGDTSSFVTKGSWSVREDGKTILLDPEDKDEYDRMFEVVSGTELRALDREGKAMQSGNAALTRR